MVAQGPGTATGSGADQSLGGGAVHQRWLCADNEMCERAGMSERQIYERTKAVFGYFNLPFDVQG